MTEPSLVDLCIKILARCSPGVFFRIARLEVSPGAIRTGDVTVAVAEFRADHVYIVEGGNGAPEWALHLEVQLQPDRRVVRGWFHKNAATSVHLDLDVLLVALYLRRGDRASFPDAYRVEAGGLTNEFRFPTVRLWEEAERIRSGELAELAPLLVLCEDKPAEEIIREELALIRQAEAPPETRSELVAVAYMLGARYLLREVLDTLFQEDTPMLENLGIISDWIADGEARGEARGRTEEARRIRLRLLRARFGELPAELSARIEAADPEWCEALAEQALRVESLQELRLS